MRTLEFKIILLLYTILYYNNYLFSTDTNQMPYGGSAGRFPIPQFGSYTPLE